MIVSWEGLFDTRQFLCLRVVSDFQFEHYHRAFVCAMQVLEKLQSVGRWSRCQAELSNEISSKFSTIL